MNEWLPTLSLALGSAWTSGINLYATVTVLGVLQKFGWTRLPGGLEVLDNWWIIGVAAFLYLIEFFADKIPYVDSVWDAIHTFIRIPAGAIVAYGATNQMDSSVHVIATLIGGGLAFSSHGTKAAVRATANLSPEPVSNWILSLVEDVIAIVGAILSVVAPILIAVFLIIFLIFFAWFFPKVIRAVRRIFKTIRAFFRGESFSEIARKSS
jgi:CBS domain containing-hemolysin-like protein